MRSKSSLWALAALCATLAAHADVVADWADKATLIATDGPNTTHTLALAEGAVYEAVNAVTQRYPRDHVDLGPAQGASIDAAVAAATRTVLLNEARVLQPQIEAAYNEAITRIPADAGRALGISLGERAATDVLAKHVGDLGDPEPYRPTVMPGAYVPTTQPLGWTVWQQKPWFMKSAAQFRPGPPPDLKSKLWARDYNEVKSVGALNSTARTPEQTAIARFWATALPDIHMGIVASLARSPGREPTRNARLYAVVTAAINEAEIAVLEAKYHYRFWRPITAIRNGDIDGNAETERDPSWQPLIVTPLHPEYPCGHCIIASTIATVIRAETRGEPLPTLSTQSNTAPGETRYWSRTQDFVQECSNGRIWDGVHYRTSAEVGNRMGEQIGALVVAAYGLQ